MKDKTSRRAPELPAATIMNTFSSPKSRDRNRIKVTGICIFYASVTHDGWKLVARWVFTSVRTCRYLLIIVSLIIVEHINNVKEI